MVKISILYPNDESATFDFDYFLDSHMPETIRLLCQYPGYQGVSVERGVAGGLVGTPATYQAICHFSFDSLAEFMDAYMTHAEELQADLVNVTNIEPVVQISEVVMQ